MTLIIAATVTAPIFTVPFITRGLALDWNAEDLLSTVQDGATVTSWSSRGNGAFTADHGTFAFANTNSAFPILDADGCNGQACITMEGFSSFKTFNGSGGGPTTGVGIVTASIVARVRHAGAFVNQHPTRILTGAQNTQSPGRPVGFRPSGDGRLYWGTGDAGLAGPVLSDPTGWKIFTSVIDGEDSLLKVSGLPIQTGNNAPGHVFKGVCLGLSPGVTSVPSDVANCGIDVAAIRFWDRPLREDEILAQHESWAAEFGVAV